MNEGNDIPFPVLFNPFKHHRNFILQALGSMDPELIICLLEAVCNNYIDIYTGDMTPDTIGREVIEILQSEQVLVEDEFTNWIKSGYQQIKLKDQSEWILRKSENSKQYIHIHPARTGSNTIRFKGSTLKTIYMLKANPEGFQNLPSLEDVNRIRSKIALSPVKKLEKNKGIMKCCESFFEVK
jgi:hypothetical protein